MGKIIQLWNKKKEKVYPVTTTDNVVMKNGQTFQGSIDDAEKLASTVKEQISARETREEKEVSDYGENEVDKFKQEMNENFKSSLHKIYDKLVSSGATPAGEEVSQICDAIKELAKQQAIAGRQREINEQSFTMELYTQNTTYNYYNSVSSAHATIWDKRGKQIAYVNSNKTIYIPN